MIDRAIASASRFIDSYVQRRQRVPLDPVPERVREVAAEEAVYRLKLWKRQVTPEDAEQHRETLEWLQDVASGRASLGEDPHPTPSTAVVGEVGDREDCNRRFTSSKNSGLW